MVILTWNNMSIPQHWRRASHNPTGRASAFAGFCTVALLWLRRTSSGRYRAAAGDRVEQDDAILRRRLLVLTSHQLAFDDHAGSIGLGARVDCARFLKDLLRVVG